MVFLLLLPKSCTSKIASNITFLKSCLAFLFAELLETFLQIKALFVNKTLHKFALDLFWIYNLLTLLLSKTSVAMLTSTRAFTKLWQNTDVSWSIDPLNTVCRYLLELLLCALVDPAIFLCSLYSHQVVIPVMVTRIVYPLLFMLYMYEIQITIELLIRLKNDRCQDGYLHTI